jgi:hypothetical protein
MVLQALVIFRRTPFFHGRADIYDFAAKRPSSTVVQTFSISRRTSARAFACPKT